MSSVTMQHADPATEARASEGAMRYERRAARRHHGSVYATGVLSDPLDPTRPKRICAVELVDVSDTGLGAVSGEPLPTGARISLFVTAHGPYPGIEFRGTVVRCRERADGYEAGIALTGGRRAA